MPCSRAAKEERGLVFGAVLTIVPALGRTMSVGSEYLAECPSSGFRLIFESLWNVCRVCWFRHEEVKTTGRIPLSSMT